MPLPTIVPLTAKRPINQGALLVDIRKAHEHAGERILGTRNELLTRPGPVSPGSAKAVIFHRRSGACTAANVVRLAAAAEGSTYLPGGGINAWKRAGLPVQC